MWWGSRQGASFTQEDGGGGLWFFLPVSCCVHMCTTSNAFHPAALLWKASWRGWQVLEEEWRTGPVGREPQQWSSGIGWAAKQGANSSKFKGKIMCLNVQTRRHWRCRKLSPLFTRFWVSLCKKSNELAVETPERACRLLKQCYNNDPSTHPGALELQPKAPAEYGPSTR